MSGAQRTQDGLTWTLLGHTLKANQKVPRQFQFGKAGKGKEVVEYEEWPFFFLSRFLGFCHSSVI